MNADVTPAMDVEQLMMDALDGALNERDRRMLDAYLAQHPAERAMFERICGVDLALQSVPVVSAPRELSGQILRAVAQSHVAQPPLKATQIAFLIAVASVLVVLAGLLALGLYTLFSPAFPQAELLTVTAFLRGLVEFGISAFGVGATLLRAVFTQPTAWLVTLGLGSIVALWLRVMFVVMIPGLRPAAA